MKDDKKNSEINFLKTDIEIIKNEKKIWRIRTKN